MSRKYPVAQNPACRSPRFRNSLKNFKTLPPGASPEHVQAYALLVATLGQTDELSQELAKLRTRIKKLYSLIVGQSE